MAGRKRKLPPDFVPEPWLEPASDEEGEWRVVHNTLLLTPQEVNFDETEDVDEDEEEEEEDEDDDQAEEQVELEDEEEENDDEAVERVVLEEEEERDDHEAVERVVLEEEGEEEEDDDEAEERVQIEFEEEENDDEQEGEGEEHGEGEAEISNNSSDDDNDEHANFESFKARHDKLVRDWTMTELNHHVSKAAANSFWQVADQHFHKLYEAKEREGISKKVPKFMQVRKNLYDKQVPQVSMQVAYKHKVTGEISLVETIDSTPTSQYPPDVYTKLYEVASVEVIT